jgi:hypothetical protein
MKETRIQVIESDIRGKSYQAQYKCKTFWGKHWEDFNIDSRGLEYEAVREVYWKTYQSCCDEQATAKRIIDAYVSIHQKKLAETEEKALHEMTKKVSWYKYP